MIEHGFDRRGFLGADEHAHFRDPHDATFGGHRFYGFVRFAPRMSGIERATVGMRDQNRLFGYIKSLESGAIAAVGDVDGHPKLVHALNDRDAEIRETFVAALCRTVTKKIARVVSELRHALPEPVEIIHVVHFAEVL